MKNEIKNNENTVDKEKILEDFASGTLTITLDDEMSRQFTKAFSIELERITAEYDFIKNALEKQIPKKPKNQRLAEGILGDNGIYAGNCPSCEEKVIGNYYGEYCGCCGQRLDWSE